jgi:toluene monooxygenase electron transfer component
MARVTLAGTETIFECGPGETLLAGALRAGLGLQYECNAGRCGACKVKMVEGETDPLWPESPVWTEGDRRRGRVLACQAAPVGNCVISAIDDPARRPALPFRSAQARLVGIYSLTQDMVELVLHTAEPAVFLPGQFAALTWPDGVRRMYSMSNLANIDGEWRFVIKRTPAGRFSGRLMERGVEGSVLTVEAPYGAAYLRPTGRPILCLGGGSGLGAMLSIARGFSADPAFNDQTLCLLVGARTLSDLADGALLDLIGAIDPRVHVHASLSDPTAVNRGWTGAQGNLDVLAWDILADSLSRHDIYMAGPPGMIDSVLAVLRQAGVESQHVHYDRFY